MNEICFNFDDSSGKFITELFNSISPYSWHSHSPCKRKKKLKWTFFVSLKSSKLWIRSEKEKLDKILKTKQIKTSKTEQNKKPQKKLLHPLPPLQLQSKLWEWTKTTAKCWTKIWRWSSHRWLHQQIHTFANITKQHSIHTTSHHMWLRPVVECTQCTSRIWMEMAISIRVSTQTVSKSQVGINRTVSMWKQRGKFGWENLKIYGWTENRISWKSNSIYCEKLKKTNLRCLEC